MPLQLPRVCYPARKMHWECISWTELFEFFISFVVLCLNLRMHVFTCFHFLPFPFQARPAAPLLTLGRSLGQCETRGRARRELPLGEKRGCRTDGCEVEERGRKENGKSKSDAWSKAHASQKSVSENFRNNGKHRNASEKFRREIKDLIFVRMNQYFHSDFSECYSQLPSFKAFWRTNEINDIQQILPGAFVRVLALCRSVTLSPRSQFSSPRIREQWN